MVLRLAPIKARLGINSFVNNYANKLYIPKSKKIVNKYSKPNHYYIVYTHPGLKNCISRTTTAHLDVKYQRLRI